MIAGYVQLICRGAGRALVVAIAACLVAPAAVALELKIATLAPDGSDWMREMRAGAERIESATQGRVKLKLYPGGVMGEDAQVLRKIRIGQLQGGAFTSSGLADVVPALDIYGIPLLFRSLDEVDYVRARLDPVLIEKLREAGFESFGFVESGFAELMSNKPVSSVEDLKRQKVWIPEGDSTSSLALEAIGVSPVPLPVTDVLTGLQTGLLDVVAASPVVALVLQWHTRVKYVTDLPVLYTMGTLAIDSKVYATIRPDDRKAIDAILREISMSLDHTAREDNARALEAMLEHGVRSVSVNADQVEGWRAQIETIYPKLRAKPRTDAEFLDRTLELLREYRRSGGAANVH